jgi:thiamine biosynthesis lipoprotein
MNNTKCWKHGFVSMGTGWEIQVWDSLSEKSQIEIQQRTQRICSNFDALYSRFRTDSLISTIAREGSGTYTVPSDFVQMLRIYFQLYQPTNYQLNPLIGYTLSDLGYDASYSLKRTNVIRSTPMYSEAIEIIDNETIQVHTPVLIDIGALGKGYAVDLLYDELYSMGLTQFLVNGSGDIRYCGSSLIRAGLEDPEDPKKVIGIFPLREGSLAASGINRRSWRDTHHIVNPKTNQSAKNEYLATWVHAEHAVIADALATALLLVPAAHLKSVFEFSYCIMYKNRTIKKSADFPANFL